MDKNLEYQQGNILITSLLILLVMNLLGLGLINSAVKDTNVATHKSIESEVFHVAESCTQDMIAYLEALTEKPDAPYTISEDDLSDMYTGNESDLELNRLSGYSYSCTLNELTSIAVTADDTGEGEALGDGDGYSSNAHLEPKYYYQIISTGLGPKNATKTINTIVSLQF